MVLSYDTLGSIYISSDAGDNWLVQGKRYRTRMYWCVDITIKIVLESHEIICYQPFTCISQVIGFHPCLNWFSIYLIGYANLNTLLRMCLIFLNSSSVPLYYLVGTGGAGVGFWSGIACSSNSSRLVAVQNMTSSGEPGLVYLSSDSGATWEKQSVEAGYWAGVAMSQGIDDCRGNGRSAAARWGKQLLNYSSGASE